MKRGQPGINPSDTPTKAFEIKSKKSGMRGDKTADHVIKIITFTEFGLVSMDDIATP